MLADDLIGVSIRTAANVGRVSERRLRSWEHTGLLRPAVRHEVNERKIARVYDFTDLVEIHVIRELESGGLSSRHIRRIVDAVRSDDIPSPLRQLTWATDGKDAYVQYPDGTWVGGRRPTQTVMAGILDLESIRINVRRALQAKRKRSTNSERHRRVLGAKPVFEGTRTPIAAVQAYLKRGVPVKEILDAYPHLTAADIRYARESMTAA